MRHIPSGKLERWLGSQAEAISASMRHWYGHGIPVAGVPGRCIAQPGGDFTGFLDGGDFMSLQERQYERSKQFARKLWRKMGKVRHGSLNAGFPSMSDLVSEMTVNNKRLEMTLHKVGTLGVVNVTNTLWFAAGQPGVGATAGNAPGGTAHSSASAGAIPYTNPTGGDTLHFLNAFVQGTVGANSLLLYDRIFSVNKTMNSSATEAVTGVPTRYQNTTGGTIDSAENNFLMVEVRTALPATAHNWTVCTYTDQSGNAGATLPSLTGNASAIINRLDHPVGQWAAPLASGDSGIKALTQMQCSAAVATGAIEFTIGHALVHMPLFITNVMTLTDGLGDAFNLTRIFDSACLALLETLKGATTATTYSGTLLSAYG